MSQPPPSQQPPPPWAPGWTPPGPPAPAGPPPAGKSSRPVGPLLLAAGAGLLAGLLGSGLVVAGLFAVAAEDIGESMADRLGPVVEDAIVDGTLEAMEESFDDYGAYPEDVYGGSVEDVEVFDPVPPEGLGPDPVLDGYARECFDGALQACDDLLYEAPPLSAYEEYGLTCAGRVKSYSIGYCTDLD
jgi:hypothetical protein